MMSDAVTAFSSPSQKIKGDDRWQGADRLNRSGNELVRRLGPRSCAEVALHVHNGVLCKRMLEG